jgi:hypothetical protein
VVAVSSDESTACPFGARSVTVCPATRRRAGGHLSWGCGVLQSVEARTRIPSSVPESLHALATRVGHEVFRALARAGPRLDKPDAILS